jgi:hypothetical protein
MNYYKRAEQWRCCFISDVVLTGMRQGGISVILNNLKNITGIDLTKKYSQTLPIDLLITACHIRRCYGKLCERLKGVDADVE